jgi:hypothetical protein
MTKRWKNEAGYVITLLRTSTRSCVDVRDSAGHSMLYHQFDYWQQDQAEREAEALALLSHAQQIAIAA